MKCFIDDNTGELGIIEGTRGYTTDIPSEREKRLAQIGKQN